MGHYDNCRPGYCPSCGAAPGNLASNGGVCPFCEKRRKASPPKPCDKFKKSIVFEQACGRCGFTEAEHKSLYEPS